MNRTIARARRLLNGFAAYSRQLPQRGYIDVRASHPLGDYRRRRDHYAGEVARRGLRYDRELVAERTASRLSSSGIHVRPRQRGGAVHTLAFFPKVSWHAQLLEPLRALGPLSYFDYNEHGVATEDLWARKPNAVEGRRTACAAFERFAADAARTRPIDWVFVYAMGFELPVSTLERVRSITGAPVVGMCLDDKQSWEHEPFGGEPAGQMVLARSLDIGWTSAREACDWYLAEGGNPVFMGEGSSPDVYRPSASPPDLDVCFVGAGYGFRPWFIRQLERAGLRVTTAGYGWPAGAASEDAMIGLMQRSKVILGLGGVGWSMDLKNLKGRDFDAPCVGPYLTAYNPDLAEMFRIGEEIACYSTPDEAVEIARALLRDPQQRRRLAESGRARSVGEHTWSHRFATVLDLLGVWR